MLYNMKISVLLPRLKQIEKEKQQQAGGMDGFDSDDDI
jgi:hypothetical protein